MSALLSAALDRTVLLARYVVPHASTSEIVAALTTTRACVMVDEMDVASGACQSALLTFAQLTMEMGCSVRYVGPDAALRQQQPPWRGRTVLGVLRDMAIDSLPDVSFEVVDAPEHDDLVFAFGGARSDSDRGWRVGASRWSGAIAPINAPWTRWSGDFSVGGLAGATLAATEVFKSAMRRLGPTGTHAEELAPSLSVRVTLASEDTPVPLDLGRVDCVSGGAIVQAALHVLLRVPSLAARVRVLEPDSLEATNQNRYSLARRSWLGASKVACLERCSHEAFVIEGQVTRVEEGTLPSLVPLAPMVIVGTDNVPSRWVVQGVRPRWLVIGATSEFMAMVSEHDGSSGCAGCAHPYDDGVRATTPTVSFVSYWAGLLVATRVLRTAAAAARDDQIVLLSSLRLDSAFGEIRYPNARSARCPMRCKAA